jgi:hypothetical protein
MNVLAWQGCANCILLLRKDLDTHTIVSDGLRFILCKGQDTCARTQSGLTVLTSVYIDLNEDSFLDINPGKGGRPDRPYPATKGSAC